MAGYRKVAGTFIIIEVAQTSVTTMQEGRSQEIFEGALELLLK